MSGDTLDYVQIGKALKTAREARGWSQTAVGKQLGYTGAYISLVEKGTCAPSPDFLKKHAELVGCGFAVIFAAHDDRRALLVTRLALAIQSADEAVLSTFEAWADLLSKRTAENSSS